MSIGAAWAPAYETLFHGEKRGLSHAARGVFIGLCIEARKANRRGVVALPRGETNPVAGVRELIGGRLEEVDAALRELLAEQDPMVRVEGQPGRLTCRVLSWSPRWVLGEALRDEVDVHPRADYGSFDLRAWRRTNGATQDDAARILGLSRSRIADVEAQRRSLRDEEVAKLVASHKAPAVSGACPDNVTHLSDICPDAAPTSGPTLPRHCPDGDPDIAPTATPTSARRSPDVGGVRGGVSAVYTQEIREEKKREEEREISARAPDAAPTSGPTLPRHCPDGDPDIAPTATPTSARRSPDVLTSVSADDLLAWTSSPPCLRALTRDSVLAREWAEDTAAGLAMEATRPEDVRAAISAFVTQRGNSVRSMGREELVEALGSFLKNAKRYGDIDRARRERASRTEQRGAAVAESADEAREAQRRIMPGRKPPPPPFARGSTR